jgi:hypothetical protein
MQISRGIAGLHSVNGIPGKTRECGSLPTVRVGFHETRGGSLGKPVTTQSYPSHLKPPFLLYPPIYNQVQAKKCSNLSRSLRAGKLGGESARDLGQHNIADIKGISNLKHSSTSVRALAQQGDKLISRPIDWTITMGTPYPTYLPHCPSCP